MFNGPLSGTTRVSWYQKGKTNLDFTEARDSEWQWHQLGDMQVCTLLQIDYHASTRPLSFTGRVSFLPPNQQRQSTEGQLSVLHRHRKCCVAHAPRCRSWFSARPRPPPRCTPRATAMRAPAAADCRELCRPFAGWRHSPSVYCWPPLLSATALPEAGCYAHARTPTVAPTID